MLWQRVGLGVCENELGEDGSSSFPKQGLRRMCDGIVSLATPDLERDVRDFFATRKIDLGGKTLEQYLEQLRIGVNVRERGRNRAASVPPGFPVSGRERR